MLLYSLNYDVPCADYFRLSESLPTLCDAYVNGCDGVGKSIYDHSEMLWQKFLNGPADMLDKTSGTSGYV